MLCMEVWRERRVERNDYLLLCLNVFKIKGKGNN